MAIAYLALISAIVSAQSTSYDDIRLNVTIQADSYMPVLSVAINGELKGGQASYYIDTNATTTYFWTSTCTVTDGIDVERACKTYPTYANESIDTTSSAWTSLTANHDTSSTQGGFVSSGSSYTTQMIVEGLVSVHPNSWTIQGDFLAVDSITQDTWLYGTNAVSGAIALSNNSPLMLNVSQYPTQSQSYIICLGDVLQWSWMTPLALPDTTDVAPFFFINGTIAEFDTILSEIANSTAIPLTMNMYNQFEMEYLKIGNYSDSEQAGYFEKIEFTNTTGFAYDKLELGTINPSYQGMGMPYRFWNMLVAYMKEYSYDVATQMICHEELGGKCIMTKSCDQYADFLSLSLQFGFEHTSVYAILPLASFAMTNSQTNQCEIFIQVVNSTESTYNQLFLGSMFMQAFAVQYDFASDARIILHGSKFFTLQGTYIQNNELASGSGFNPFQEQANSTLPLYVDGNTLKVSIDAKFAGQNSSKFAFGLNYPYLTTFAQDCVQASTEVSCSDAPYYAQDYFNNSGYQAQKSFVVMSKLNPKTQNTFFSVKANSYRDQVCLPSNDLLDHCSSPTADFWSVTSFNWPVAVGQTQDVAGLIGLGEGSPIWLQEGNVVLKFNNLTDWTWAGVKNDNFQSNITLTNSTGQLSYYFSNSTLNNASLPNSVFFINDTNSLQPEYFSNFSFGINYTNNSAYYSSLIGSDNVTYQFDSTVAGLVLAENYFKEFKEMLYILQKGDIDCPSAPGAHCVLDQSCENYADLMNYSFRFSLNNTLNVTLPLATFAVSQGNLCKIFVEYQEYTALGNPVSNEVIFGNMLYQSFTGVSGSFVLTEPNTLKSTHSTGMVLSTNNLSLGTIFEGQIANSTAETVAANPFLDGFSSPYILLASINSTNGMLVVEAAVNQKAEKTQFLLDFNATNSYFYTTDCIMKSGESCMDAPVYANASIDTSTASWTSLDQDNLGSISQGGMQMSGNYFQVPTFLTANSSSDYNAPTSSIWLAVDKIEEDMWLYNVPQASGALAFGKASDLLWQIGNYTMEYNGEATDADSVNIQVQIVTGDVMDFTWLNSTASLQTFLPLVQISSGSDTSLISDNVYAEKDTDAIQWTPTSVCANGICQNGYPVTNFSIGTANETTLDGYFYELSSLVENGQTVTLAEIKPNYQGLGLPNRFYAQTIEYLRQTSEDVGYNMICSAEGACTLPNACATYTELWDISFMIGTNSVYDSTGIAKETIYAPLALFANNTDSGTCDIYIQNVNSTETDPSNVFLGSMFMQGFVATWNYNNVNQESYNKNTAVLILQPSAYCSVPNVYTTISPFEQGAVNLDPFQARPEPYLFVDIDIDSLDMTIQANFGYQGVGDFRFDMYSKDISIFASNITDLTYATPYFDYQNYIAGGNFSYYPQDQQFASGVFYQDLQFCLGAINSTNNFSLCNLQGGLVNVVDVADENVLYENQFFSCGIIGLGAKSPIWNVFPPNNFNSVPNVLIQFSNLTDWAWANDDYVQPSNFNNNLTIGHKQVYDPTDKYTIYIDLSDETHQQNTTFFGFGLEYSSTSSYYRNLTDGIQPNISFSTIQPGMVLSTDLFNYWQDLLSVISEGQFTCTSTNDGHCIAKKSCSEIDQSIFEYKFRFNVLNVADQYNITAPLSTFAVDRIDQCDILISPSDYTLNATEIKNNVILGNMFFQSFSGVSKVGESMAISVNPYSQNTIFEGHISNDTEQQMGPNPFNGTYLASPYVLKASINSTSSLIVVNAGINLVQSSKNLAKSDYDETEFLLDFNATNSYFFALDCNMTAELAPDINATSCMNAPVYANASVNTTGAAWTSAADQNGTIKQGGYTMSGSSYPIYTYLTGNSSSLYNLPIESFFDAVEEVSQDNWLYNVPVASGALAFGKASNLIWTVSNYTMEYSYLNPAADHVNTQVLIVTGDVLDYAWLNSTATYYPQLPTVQIKGGNDVDTSYGYGLVLQWTPSTACSNGICQNGYPVTYFGFGTYEVYPDGTKAQYFEEITTLYEIDNKVSLAEVKPNYQGLGLPYRYWAQIVSYIKEATGNQDMICDSGLGGKCSIPSACNLVPELQQLYFQIGTNNVYDTTGDHQSYISVPLVMFANNTASGECDIFIQVVNSTDTDPSNVFLGTMFMQGFAITWNYENINQESYTENAVELFLQKSVFSSVPGVGIYQYSMPDAFVVDDPFIYRPKMELNVTVDQDSYDLSIIADFGFQGESSFKFDLYSDEIYLIQSNVEIGSQCSNTIYNPYFDASNYGGGTNKNIAQNITADGEYNITGQSFSGLQFCMAVVSNNDFPLCNLQQGGDVSTVASINWPYVDGINLKSGEIGLGQNSSVWGTYSSSSLKNITNVEMEFANFTDFTWANKSSITVENKTLVNNYTSPNITNNITLGTHFTYDRLDRKTFVVSLTEEDNSQQTSFFGFGKQNVTLNEAYYVNLSQSKSKSDQPSISFSTLQAGVVMSQDLYNYWKELMDVVTFGEADCASSDNANGNCFLAFGCDHYRDTLMEYSFRFNTNETFADQWNVTVPFAAFAVDHGSNICELFVSPANFTQGGKTLSNNITFGTMFFQSFWGLSQTSESMALRVNQYANNTLFSGAIANNTNQTLAKNPFEPSPADVPTSVQTTKGLQTFEANITGITLPDDVTSPYFYLDFTNANTVVWSKTCMNEVNDTACSEKPLLMQSNFTGTGLGTTTFTEERFNGYEVSGKVYEELLCFQDRCEFVDIYSGEQISQDLFMYDVDGAYGILGFGPTSTLWSSFMVPGQTKVSYSVIIGNHNLYADDLSITDTQISIGADLPTNYNESQYIFVQADINTQAFQYQNFAFGKITYNTDPAQDNKFEKPQDESFESLLDSSDDSDSDLEFMLNMNAQGIILPEDMWDEFTDLYVDALSLNAMTGNCTSDAGGSCMFVGYCSSFEFLAEYQFKLTIEGQTNHLNIPLGAFAQLTDDRQNCKINVQQTVGKQIIFGGMFFQNFFGYFTNEYSNNTVSVSIFESGEPALPNCYLGDRVLPTNPVSPFNPPDESTDSYIGVIITGCVLLLIALIVGGICINKLMNKNAEEKKVQQENEENAQRLLKESTFVDTEKPAMATSNYSINE